MHRINGPACIIKYKYEISHDGELIPYMQPRCGCKKEFCKKNNRLCVNTYSCKKHKNTLEYDVTRLNYINSKGNFITTEYSISYYLNGYRYSLRYIVNS